ncbi:MAG: LON peptidase substrate-binding domain-containing protein [Bacteroidota bacterium]
MTQKFALFPLQLVVFPGETLNLHIFEPRYRQLIEDAEEEGTTWIVPSVIEGGIRPVATEVRLTEVVNRYPSGESDVRALGETVHFLEDFWKVLPGKMYPGGAARPLEVDFEEVPELNSTIIEMAREIYRSLSIDKVVKNVDEGFLTYDIGHYVGLTLEQEYEFLTLRKAVDRQTFLLEHLKNIRPDVEGKTKIKARAQLNGHFQELTPPNW